MTCGNNYTVCHRFDAIADFTVFIHKHHEFFGRYNAAGNTVITVFAAVVTPVGKGGAQRQDNPFAAHFADVTHIIHKIQARNAENIFDPCRSRRNTGKFFCYIGIFAENIVKKGEHIAVKAVEAIRHADFSAIRQHIQRPQPHTITLRRVVEPVSVFAVMPDRAVPPRQHHIVVDLDAVVRKIPFFVRRIDQHQPFGTLAVLVDRAFSFNFRQRHVRADISCPQMPDAFFELRSKVHIGHRQHKEFFSALIGER